MHAESRKSTIILQKIITIAHPKPFLIPNIGLTGLVTWTTQICVETTGRQRRNVIESNIMALRIQTPLRSEM
jgi:hypothetical protein